METIDVHSRSFALKWIHIPDGAQIIFQVKPIKRSICFSVYRSTEDKLPPPLYNAGGESLNSSATSLQQLKRSSSSRSIPLQERLRNSSLVEVKSYGMLHGNELFKSELRLDQGGIFAFVFDNTFSKSYAKKVLFNKFFVEERAVVRRLSTSTSSVNLQSQLHPHNGQYLQGYLLKKKRKKLQGFIKRFFVLNFKYNTLSYFMNEHTHTLRGEMQINLATISAFKDDDTIVIDSGVDVWILKTLHKADWDNWLNALDFIKLNSSQLPQISGGAISEDIDNSPVVSPLLPPSSKGMSPIPFAKIAETCEESCRLEEELSVIQNKLESLNKTFEIMEKKVDQAIISDTKEELQALTTYFKTLLVARDLHSTVLSPAQSVFSDDYYDAQDTLDFLEDDRIDSHVLVLPGKKSADISFSVDELSDQDDTLSVDLSPRPAVTTSAGDLSPLPLEQVKRRNDIRKSTSTPPSLFSHLRKNVGKDLSTISMPVTANEPLTILQKMAEMFEHCQLLNQASLETDCEAKMLQVATFAIANLGSFRSKERNLRKPFNPILGETFELIDEKLGYRMISEKICHRPQIFAFHCESKQWELSFTLNPEQKFWGKSVELINTGIVTLVLKSTGETFKWDQPTTLLKNIITGDRYTEPTGRVTVTSSSGLKSIVEFKKPNSGLFSAPRCEEVIMKVMNKAGKKSDCFADGNWTTEIVMKKFSDNRFHQRLYKASELLSDEASKWGFTVFASNLNDITSIEKGKIPLTDSRARPDVRQYEEGRVDDASSLKVAIEQRQRDRRKEVADANSVHQPLFFTNTDASDKMAWEVIKGENGYWERRKVGNWDGLTELW